MESVVEQTSVTIPEFRRREPQFKSDAAVYAAIRSGLLPHYRCGRRVFIDLVRWQEFKRNGGQALPGGWRREPIAS
jgi:hypothetical protein